MCGISGIIGTAANHQLLLSLLSEISHRGEDIYFAESDVGNGYAIGMNRLAIVDPQNGKQPFFSPNRDVLCICNGEIYNYSKLKKLYKKEYNFRSNCDSEVILAGYLKEGANIFKKLEGMYAIFILDLRDGKNNFYLARDHLGIKPIYYAENNGNFYFSSEIKSLSKLDEISQIKALEAGAILKNDKIITEGKKYFFNQSRDIDFAPNSASKKDAKKLLFDAVKKMLPEKSASVACLLSGGVDSSTVLYLAKKIHPGPIVAYTFYNQGSKSGDYEAASLLCSKLNVELRTVSPKISDLTDFYLNSGVKMVETFETPLVRNAVSYYFLCQKVRQDGYKFALSGEGADEIFGGYDYLNLLPKEQVDQAIENSLFDINRTYLQMADRASMRANLEVRVPYMDEDFVAYITKLPAEYRVNSKGNKWLLRNMFVKALPKEIRLRNKVGMNQGAGYGSNDPGESIYYAAVENFYQNHQEQYQKDLSLAKSYQNEYQINLGNMEEVFNFSKYFECGYIKLNHIGMRPQLNVSNLI